MYYYQGFCEEAGACFHFGVSTRGDEGVPALGNKIARGWLKMDESDQGRGGGRRAEGGGRRGRERARKK